MTWVAVGVAGVTTVTGMFGARRARREQQRRLDLQALLEEDATAQQRRDDAAVAEAAQAQRDLLFERERLAEQAEDEAGRQAKLASVDTTVEIASVGAADRRKRRASFYGDGA